MARRPFSGGKGSRHSKAGSPANRNIEYATAGRHERAADPVSRAFRRDSSQGINLVATNPWPAGHQSAKDRLGRPQGGSVERPRHRTMLLATVIMAIWCLVSGTIVLMAFSAVCSEGCAHSWLLPAVAGAFGN
jgi:hypothetical protein